MLPISSDKIAEVILLARELDRAENELDGLIDRLAEDAQAALVAVLWVGRGSFEPENLKDTLKTATQEAMIPTSEYLKRSPHLFDHLGAELGALGIDPSVAEHGLC